MPDIVPLKATFYETLSEDPYVSKLPYELFLFTFFKGTKRLVL